MKHEKIFKENFLCLRNPQKLQSNFWGIRKIPKGFSSIFPKRKFQRSKKSIIEVQFHWIFIMIAGVLILLFFTTLIFRQKNVSEQYLATDIINNLEGIITGASVSPKTLHIIETPRAEIDFTCEDYSVKGVRATTGQRIIFAPNKLFGRKLIPWALDWDVPFRATNFLFLATDEFKFVFVYDPANTFMEEIYEDFKTDEDSVRYTTQFVNPNDGDISLVVKDTNNYKVRFVFYGETTLPDILSGLQSMPNKDVTAINIKPYTESGEINNDFGQVEFYVKRGNNFEYYTGNIDTSTSVYLKKPSLIGAIFTEDPEVYNCVMGKAFRRVNLATNVYINRRDFIKSGLPQCSALYSSPTSDELSDIKSSTNTFPSGDIPSMQSLYDAISDLVERNEALKLASCPTIY